MAIFLKLNRQQNERQPTVWENILANDISIKGLVSKIYEEFLKLNTKKNNLIIKMGRGPEETFS